MIEPYPEPHGTVSSGDTTTESRRGKLPIGSVSPTGWLPCWKPPAVPRRANKRGLAGSLLLRKLFPRWNLLLLRRPVSPSPRVE